MTARTIRPLNDASIRYCLNSMPGMSNCILMTKQSPAIFFQCGRSSLLRNGVGKCWAQVGPGYGHHSLTWPQSTPSNHSKSWLFTSTAQNFAINRINRHLCTTFADPDGVALGSSIHLC